MAEIVEPLKIIKEAIIKLRVADEPTIQHALPYLRQTNRLEQSKHGNVSKAAGFKTLPLKYIKLQLILCGYFYGGGFNSNHGGKFVETFEKSVDEHQNIFYSIFNLKCWPRIDAKNINLAAILSIYIINNTRH
jgi:hypothetical protein